MLALIWGAFKSLSACVRPSAFHQSRSQQFDGVSFPEEDPKAGYFACHPGCELKDSQYTILRKLGWGPKSTVWLAKDASDSEEPVAIKIYTVAATRAHAQGRSHEVEALQEISKPPFAHPGSHVIWKDDFIELGELGKHLCIVTYPSAQTLADYIATCDGGQVPPLIVKRVAAQVLEALMEIHDRGVVHGNITALNTFFGAHLDVRTEAVKQPAEWHEPSETLVDGELYPLLKSRPLCMPWHGKDDPFTSELYSVLLGGFGSARFIGREAPDNSISPAAPEASRGNASMNFDIRGLGYLVVEMMTGDRLVGTLRNRRGDGSAAEDHVTPASDLAPRPSTDGFLESGAGDFESHDPRTPPGAFGPPADLSGRLRDDLSESKRFSASDLDICVDFVEQCLGAHRGVRPTAKQLWCHPFLEGAYCCCEGGDHDHD